MRPTNFATHLTAFLTSYLPAQRNVSPNTIRAYRDAFVLLLRYCRDVRRLAPDRLSLEQIDPSLVLDFLDHLEKERRCAPAPVTYGSRPSMPSSGTSRQKSRGSCSAVNGSWPSPSSAVRLRLWSTSRRRAWPPSSTSRTWVSAGRRDAILLSLLYDTGARVQELIDLSVRDVRLESPAQVRLIGKGRRCAWCR